MNIKKVLSVLSFCLLSITARASEVLPDSKACVDDKLPVFLILGTGAAFSNNANISANNSVWDTAEQGYNARLGNSEFYTAGIGVSFTPLVAASLEATRRPSFSYSKYQTPPDSASSTPGFLGDKTRYFDLANTSVMANLLLNGQGLDWTLAPTNNISISPFVGLGAGVSYNEVSNFHSVLPITNSSTTGSTVASVMSSNTTSAFAWQAMLGVDMRYKQKFGVEIGYRYFDGGVFHTNNYIQADNTALAGEVPPWKGRLTTNEAFLNLKYYI